MSEDVSDTDFVEKDQDDPITSTPRSSPRSSKTDINVSRIRNISKESAAFTDLITTVSGESGTYRPIPYVFRIPPNLVTVASGQSSAKSPPFHVQLDHALAVIWTIFSQEPTKKPLGVAQLHWALSFLKGIRNRQGKYPKDVSVCIEALEDALIQQYASMADTVKPCDCDETVPTTVAYKQSYPTSNKNEKSLVGQKLPFSINYAEMSRNQPSGLDRSYNVPDNTFTTVNEEMNNGNKEGMREVLNTWRKEQVNKLQEELQRLHSIEEFIGNLDKGNFTRYLDKQELDALVAKRDSK